MSKSLFEKIKYKSRFLFILFVIIAALQIVCVIMADIYINKSSLMNVEKYYHDIDKVYVENYLTSVQTEDNQFDFGDVGDSYLGIIDKEGNIIAHGSVNKVNISGSNVFKYLSMCKLYDTTYEEACANIVSMNSGRIEFYGNFNRVLVYTPASDGEHFIIRVIAKKNFGQGETDYSGPVTFATWFTIIFEILIFIIVANLKKYAETMETAVARHDLIAADNNLISFTYHSSIACFEMTGAVDKIFGEAIGKRSQVDWNTLSSLLHPDDQMLLRNISKAIKDRQEKYTTEFRMINPDGEYYWYRMNAKCIDDGNEVYKFVGTIQNSDDQIAHENMLKNKAEHDLLTGLLNKITMQDSVNKALSKVAHNVFAFYIIDLDNFKAVNDNLGHAVGDKVLVDVASKLQIVFNEADYIGRLGGDEFAVLLVIPAMMISQSDKLIREKATVLNEILCADYGNDTTTISVSASIGISVYPADGADFQTLYQHADKGLYYSKEHGKNQYSFYNEI